MEEIINNHKLILVCGSGGVGKTTLSASLALKAASMGKKVMVITIDPAKRLATSMGLSSLKSEPEKVKLPDGGELYAMMLDTKKTFDKLVEAYAPDEETKNKILKNKIYIELSNIIAGSQEYMAMEKLYEVVSENKFDLIVVDTPPTTHAIDFLEAPDKMINAISGSMLHLLIKPATAVGGTALKFLAKGADFVLKIFDRIVGFAFLQEISEMLMSFQVLLAGFKSRAGEVREILERDSTTFVIVGTTDKNSQAEILLFEEKLSHLKLSLSAILINRVYPFFKMTPAKALALKEELAQKAGKTLSKKMEEVFLDYQKIAKKDKSVIDGLREDTAQNILVKEIPLFEGDIHDLTGLSKLAQII